MSFQLEEIHQDEIQEYMDYLVELHEWGETIYRVGHFQPIKGAEGQTVRLFHVYGSGCCPAIQLGKIYKLPIKVN